MNLIRAVATVGGFTMVSRVLGFVRDILIAAFLGAGPIADAFVVAFRIPNLFRRLVAEGAFTAAFVPIFSRKLEEEGEGAAYAFAAEALSWLASILLVFTLLAELAMPWVVRVLAPGFASGSDQFALTVELTRITFPYLFCMALTALLGGVLNALYRFAAMSAAPVLLNVILIAALLAFHQSAATPGHVLAWGVFAAGFAQLVFLVVSCRRAGVALKVVRPRLTASVRRLARLMLPGAIGAGVTQINIIVGTAIASFLSTGAIAALYYADRVYQLPLGVVGVAVGTALLPMLARQIRSGQSGPALASMNRAIELSMLLTVPAAAALIAIPRPIVVVLFERGAFDTAAAEATAGALAAFAAGLPAYVLVKVLAPGFFAREDTATPVKIAVVAMVANAALSLALVGQLGHVGIALATAISAWLNAGLLALWLRRRGFFSLDLRLRTRLPRIAGATIAMVVPLWFAASFFERLTAGRLTAEIAGLAALVVGGIVVFALAAHLSGAVRLEELRSLVRGRAA